MEPGFDDFVQQAQPELYRYALALTGETAEAWDLLQDTYIRLLREWRRVGASRVGNPVGLAVTTMTRLNLNRLRSAAREGKAFARKANESRLDRYDSEPAQAAMDAVEALQTLSRQQRTAVALVHVQGLTVHAAADLMACRPNTVKTHLARGLAALRQQLPQQPSKIGENGCQATTTKS